MDSPLFFINLHRHFTALPLATSPSRFSPIMDNLSELELPRQQLRESERRREESERRREESERLREESNRRAEAAERLREESYQRAEAAERLREESYQRAEAAERLRAELERRLRNTTLFEYLDAVHTNYSLTLRVQTDPTKAAKGTISSEGNWCPVNIKAWEEFPGEQEAIWMQLQQLGGKLKSSRVFHSLESIQTNGSLNSRRKISSEQDLFHYERPMVEDPVTNIVRYFSEDPEIKKELGLAGDVAFEYHSNTLDEDMETLEISTPSNAASSLKITDHICVYQTQNGNRPCFIIESKSPPNLTVAHLEAGLHPMNPMKEMVNNPLIPAKKNVEARAKYDCSLLVAGYVAQTFSYMIDAGLEYAYISTGEALVFLRVKSDDPTTVYYYLSVPNEDVGKSTGWEAGSEGPNRLHLTAVGQILGFTIRTLSSARRNPVWVRNAKKHLKKWVVDIDEVLDQIPVSGRKKKGWESGSDSGLDSGSEYEPSQIISATDSSPASIRSGQLETLTSSGCNPDVIMKRRDERDDDEENGKDYPRIQGISSRITDSSEKPRASSSKKGVISSHQAPSDPTTKAYQWWYWNERIAQFQAIPYCTQSCLRGLLTGGHLDENCPNVESHRNRDSYHCLDPITFRERMLKQISENHDVDSFAFDRPGRRGAMFKIRLTSHGYTVAAKCTILRYIPYLLHEAAVYKHLEAIQGIYIPVCLGNIDLPKILFYDRVEFAHIMFLSWGGRCIGEKANRFKARPHVVDRGVEAIRSIHQLGVLHCDARPRNILWSKELKRVMIVNFDRSQVRKASSKQPLKLTSSNQQRKGGAGGDLMGLQGEMRLNSKKVKAEKDAEVGFDAPKVWILDGEDIENKGELATFDAPKNQILDEVTENTTNDDFEAEENLLAWELRALTL